MNKMAKISFVGDLALLSSVPVPDVSNIKQIFNDCDIVFANLECTLKGKEKINPLEKDAILLSSEKHLRVLEELNINIVNLGNNHIFDFGFEGFSTITDFLKRKKISYLGAGSNSLEARKALTMVIKNISLSFLSYVTYDTNPQISNRKKHGVNIFDLEKVIDDINEVRKKTDFIIVSLHWGAERYHYPTPGQIKASRQMIDAGADLIIGHHSHVLQGMECYKEKYIFYNLGNFYFPDIYNNGKLIIKQNEENVESIILKFEVSKEGFKNYQIFPTIQEQDGKINLAPEKNLQIHKYSKLLNKKYYFIFWKIYRVYIDLYKYHWFFLFLKGKTHIGQGQTFWRKVSLIRWRHLKAIIRDILALNKDKCDM